MRFQIRAASGGHLFSRDEQPCVGAVFIPDSDHPDADQGAWIVEVADLRGLLSLKAEVGEHLILGDVWVHLPEAASCVGMLTICDEYLD